jgi:hypothetical protein
MSGCGATRGDAAGKLGVITNGAGDNAVVRRIAVRLSPGQPEAVANALAAMPPP